MSIIRFKQPIKLPSLPSAPSEVEDGMMYYDETTNKVVSAQGGQLLDSVSTQELNDTVYNAVVIVDDELDAHVGNTSNPHAVTKSQVGLSNVDNTSDVNKPVSIANQTALNLKANIASPTFTGTVSGITKVMVGLSNVDNTSDLNKPVSSAQQIALDLKANQSTTYTKVEVDNLDAQRQPLNARLTSLSALASDGILVKSGNNILNRSVIGTAPISITNGDGVSGNITLMHANSGVTAASYGAEDKSVVLTVNALGHVTGASVVDTKPKKLNYIRVADTTTVQTTSSTPSTITSMTVTPAAGTYMCTFSGNIRGESTPHIGTTSFFLDSTQIATTVRTIENTAPLLGTPTHAISAGQISDIVTFNGSQVLTVRFNATSGTVFCLARTLILIRVD